MVPFPKSDKKRPKSFIRVYDEKLFCICKQVQDVNSDMIPCSDCGSWYHPDCVGETNTATVLSGNKKWMCETCEHMQITMS